jgi:hypothetical protein
MRQRQRRLDDLMLDGAPEDALYEVPTLAYEPDAGAVDPNLVRPMLDDYLNAEAPPAPVQVTPEFTPPDDDDAWIGEMAANYEDPTPKRGYAPEDNSKAGDGGLSAAQAQGNESYSDGAWARVLAGAFDPGGIAGRRREAWERGQQPVKDWQEGQKLAQERRRNDENEAYRRDSLEARRDAQGGNLDARNRGLDIRENTSLTPEQRRELQRTGADERIRVGDAREAGKNRRTAVMSGRRDLMENEGVLDPATGRRPVASQQEGIADALRMEMENTEGFVVTPRVQSLLTQLERTDREGGENNPLRAQYIGQLNKMLDDHQSRAAGAAEKVGEGRWRENIPQMISQINSTRNSILSHRPAGGGDAPGLRLRDRVAGEISPTLQAIVAGRDGREVIGSMKSLRDMYEKMQTGMRASGVESTRYDAILGMNWMQDTDEVLAAMERIEDRMIDEDATIIQAYGQLGGETFANRRQGAMRAAPTLQPGQSVTRGGRRFTAVGP